MYPGDEHFCISSLKKPGSGTHYLHLPSHCWPALGMARRLSRYTLLMQTSTVMLWSIWKSPWCIHVSFQIDALWNKSPLWAALLCQTKKWKNGTHKYCHTRSTELRSCMEEHDHMWNHKLDISYRLEIRPFCTAVHDLLHRTSHNITQATQPVIALKNILQIVR